MEGRGFKFHLGLGFFRVYVSPRICIISFCCSIYNIQTLVQPLINGGDAPVVQTLFVSRNNSSKHEKRKKYIQIPSRPFLSIISFGAIILHPRVSHWLPMFSNCYKTRISFQLEESRFQFWTHFQFHNGELTNRRLWLDDAIGFRDMPTVHTRKGT